MGRRLPMLPTSVVLKKVPSGEVRLQAGADGPYLQFDAECGDVLAMCQAACCALPGIEVTVTEAARIPKALLVLDDDSGAYQMKRRADGYCIANDPRTRGCTIYADRPATCADFHCTTAVGMRGWELSLNRLREP